MERREDDTGGNERIKEAEETKQTRRGKEEERTEFLKQLSLKKATEIPFKC